MDIKNKQTTGTGGQAESTGLQRGQQGQGGLSRRGLWSPLDFWTAGPFEMMRRFSEEMDRAFQGIGGRGEAGEGWGWAPAVEAFERGGRYVVRAELPGIKQEDVKVELSDDGLLIEGERKREHEEKGEGFFRSERSYGRFSRHIPLPHEALRAEDARAEFKDGVLEVSMPLPESSTRRKQIPIQRGGAAQAGTTAKPLPETRRR